MKIETQRKVDIVVISDVHLGTYGCHARELLHYLKSIKPKTVILNGDIIDIWQFSKRYFPKSHMKVIRHLMNLIGKGVKVYYITGNHDEMLRKFVGLKLGSFQVVNKVLLPLNNNEQAWFFHGDVFDVTMQYSKWLAKLGGAGYNMLIIFNRFVNYVSVKVMKRGKISFSKRIKNSVKKAVAFINDFEETAATIGIDNNYNYVICGHIHQPEIRKIENHKGSIMYLNSGDWIENLTALEYHNSEWRIYHYNKEKPAEEEVVEKEEETLDNNILFQNLVKELKLKPAS